MSPAIVRVIRLQLPAVFMLSMLVVGSSEARASTISLDRQSFEAQLISIIVDDYSSPGYFHGNLTDLPIFDRFSDAAMSAVLGETVYQTTGWVDSDMVSNPDASANRAYCAGCNGSFLLDFTQTSVGSSQGVFGVGFDMIRNYLLPSDVSPLPPGTLGYHAFVTFGDGSAADFVLPLADQYTVQSFWGITSPDLVRTIHIGLANGGVTQTSAFIMDNLTIGAQAPEPTTVVLVGGGLGCAWLRARRVTVRRKRHS